METILRVGQLKMKSMERREDILRAQVLERMAEEQRYPSEVAQRAQTILSGMDKFLLSRARMGRGYAVIMNIRPDEFKGEDPELKRHIGGVEDPKYLKGAAEIVYKGLLRMIQRGREEALERELRCWANSSVLDDAIEELTAKEKHEWKTDRSVGLVPYFLVGREIAMCLILHWEELSWCSPPDP